LEIFKSNVVLVQCAVSIKCCCVVSNQSSKPQAVINK